MARIEVIAGAPCSGKTTFVLQHRSDVDVVVDLDALAVAIGYDAERLPRSSTTYEVARSVRSFLVEGALRRGWSGTTWIIDTQPAPEVIARYRAAGGRLTVLDPGKATCLSRARAERRREVLQGIETWYAVHAGRLSMAGGSSAATGLNPSRDW